MLTGVLMLAGSVSLHAFDSQTHAYITYQAFVNSNLDNSNATALLQQLGLDRFDAPQPFSPYWLLLSNLQDFYFDNLPSGAMPLQYERPVTTYEWTQFQQLAVTGALGPSSSSIVGVTPFSPLPLANWLMRGAIREDDVLPSQYDPRDGASPDPDPYGPFIRVYNHFYDPINNQELHVGVDCKNFPSGYPLYGYSFCSKSVDWALGTVDAFTSLAPDPNRHQHFSWEDARQNEFLALTAERDANGDGIREASEREADSEERLFRWATIFRSLGDVVHLLQDAAQPQHTRDDRHDPHVNPSDQQGFEPFTNYRLIGAAALAGVSPTPGQQYVRSLVGNTSKIFNQFFTPLPDINGYPVPMFTTPLRFFTTRNPSDGPGVLPDNRYGMADYSNRGFFTRGTLPGVTSYQEPNPTLMGFTSQTSSCAFLPELQGITVGCKTYYHTVPDPLQPNRADVTTPEPLVTDGIWQGFFGNTNNGYTLTPLTYQITGNLTIPRAIAYSAGMLNYFFRGNLAITKPAAGVVGVLNLGAQHTMNAEGYPCVGTATNDGCAVFGFQTIRVSVQNKTAAITESGTNSTSTQNLSTTAAGSVTDPNFTGPYLVAVAKYHRNACYKPDLSGEPYQVYNYTPPSTGITQPACGAATTRTPYQEISVSKSVAVSAAALNGTSPTEVQFDFSSDPIPVNATDLFIQVVYRGPMGDSNGMEPDAIAVGTLDVHEPTVAAFWNNTDYFWNGSAWLHENSTYHNEGIESFNVCSGFPLKWVYQYVGGVGTPAMLDPVIGSNRPGTVRVAVILPPPDFPTQLRTVQGTPEIYSGDVHMAIEQAGTRGQIHQADRENLPTSTLAAPYAYCESTLPSSTPYWCWDPLQQRRGQATGNLQIPLYEAPLGGAGSATDVDSVPLPVFAGFTTQPAGTVRFDTDATLLSCPAQITAPTKADYQSYLNYLNLLYQARELGVSREAQPTLQH
jgi:hypothetical protein